MLYATTRNHVDAYTAQRVLTSKRGGDGGLFVPFRLTRFSEEEILVLGGRTFNANFAGMLNLLFNTRLTAGELDLAIGRYSVRLQKLGQKVVMGECWHNTDWAFSGMVRDVSRLLLADKAAEPEISGWAEVGIRIAVLFGIFGEMIREGIAGPGKNVDISLISGDFSGPMSAWYARGLGLPIGNIVCCCNENGGLWSFICHGQLRTDGVAKTTLVPEADIVVPDGLERLLALYGGPAEAVRFAETARRGETYYVEDAFLRRLRQGIYVTVSSEKRIAATIPSAFATHRYLLAPGSALAYAGLLDYRARTCEAGPALVLTEKSPRKDKDTVANALGISQEELKQLL